MKNTLLLIGTMLFFLSCDDTSNAHAIENLSDDEAKLRVEVEEINFEKDTVELRSALEKYSIEKTDPMYGGCVIEPGVMVEGLIEPPPLPESPGLPEDKVYDFPPVDAQFPGGLGEMKKFIHANLKYPLLDGGFEYRGTVYVSMVVGEDGRVQDVKIAKGIEKELDEEALRLVRSFPNWIPAEDNGKIVAAKVRLPIRFTLN
ncbi:MAG: energy transducer TonB [Crocinitomicaceae bacterium]|nr:energy transducer TonB [Flavobacteriales bacterium]NQZ37674.1 energy transducer TonB [Crocinitomicaceae bacterium]